MCLSYKHRRVSKPGESQGEEHKAELQPDRRKQCNNVRGEQGLLNVVLAQALPVEVGAGSLPL